VRAAAAAGQSDAALALFEDALLSGDLSRQTRHRKEAVDDPKVAGRLLQTPSAQPGDRG
jgi:hypothetical protein